MVVTQRRVEWREQGDWFQAGQEGSKEMMEWVREELELGEAEAEER